MTDEELDLEQMEREAQARHYPHLRREVLILVAEVRRLRSMVAGLADRVAAQSDLLSTRAER